MTELPEVDFKAQRKYPVLGPALWLFGTALWAYVVAGQLVVAEGFPEPLGALGVLFALSVSWYFAVEQSFLLDEPTPGARTRRIFAPPAIAFGLWLATTLLSTVVGLTSRDDIDSAMTLSLWLFSLVPFFTGRRMTKSPYRSQKDAGRRPLGILLWLGTTLVTLVALLPIVK